MKSTLLSFFLAFVAIPSFSQLNMQLLDQMDYPVAVNDVWGWADRSPMLSMPSLG
ncbi:MAG: hypothetical protein R2825_14135 [Saprospiraceae bacterium]